MRNIREIFAEENEEGLTYIATKTPKFELIMKAKDAERIDNTFAAIRPSEKELLWNEDAIMLSKIKKKSVEAKAKEEKRASSPLRERSIRRSRKSCKKHWRTSRVDHWSQRRSWAKLLSTKRISKYINEQRRSLQRKRTTHRRFNEIPISTTSCSNFISGNHIELSTTVSRTGWRANRSTPTTSSIDRESASSVVDRSIC